MYQQFYILVLCLLMLGGSLAAKSDRLLNRNRAAWKQNQQDGGDEWQYSNTMSRENGEDHADVRNSDVINIDETHADMVDGSGKEDGDLDDSSGHGPDDEDSDDGSADLTPCQQLLSQVNSRQLIGAFVPRCTDTGEFEKMQCHGSTGHCWCVDSAGREVSGSRKRAHDEAMCEDDSSAGYMHPEPESTAVPTRRPGRKHKTKPTDHVYYPHPTDEDNIVDGVVTHHPPKGTTDMSNVVPGIPQEVPDNSETSNSLMTDNKAETRTAIMEQPGILAGIIGGAVVGLLCAVLFVMFIVYRMRKKDEGSYALDEPKKSPSMHAYSRPSNQEFYA